MTARVGEKHGQFISMRNTRIAGCRRIKAGTWSQLTSCKKRFVQEMQFAGMETKRDGLSLAKWTKLRIFCEYQNSTNNLRSREYTTPRVEKCSRVSEWRFRTSPRRLGFVRGYCSSSGLADWARVLGDHANFSSGRRGLCRNDTVLELGKYSMTFSSRNARAVCVCQESGRCRCNYSPLFSTNYLQ